MLRRLLDLARSVKAIGLRIELVVVFANTGQEHESTLRFVDAVDKAWKVGLVWLEAVVDPRPGEGTTHRIVTFETANRDGAVFEDVIAKYGLPGPGQLHCNRELKLRPITSYLRSIGWRECQTTIGIRADEVDRISARATQDRLLYPLVGWNVTKADVLKFWSKQPFDLDLPEHLGNCTWCWKKSLRKHLTLAVEHPEVYDFPRRMEEKYQHVGAKDAPRRFFRGHRSVNDIIELAELPFEKFEVGVDPQLPLLELDMPNGDCSESCEPFGYQEAA